MKTVAIVSEYNPFHLGHARQIETVRRTFGEDAAVIAVMSGNYVQRGELAVMDKFRRAEAAVRAGVSLVLELPFPFSAAGAEFFAKGAISIIDRLGVADVLSFGSESGDLPTLARVAERLSSAEFENALGDALENKCNKGIGFASLYERVYRHLYGEDGASCLSNPNDTLAIHYLRALACLSSSVAPHTVKRTGTDKDSFGDAPCVAGATYIREKMKEQDIRQVFSHLPAATHAVWENAVACGDAPVFTEGLSSALLSHLRLSPDGSVFAECGGGLYAHLADAAREADSFSSLLSLAATKKYTVSRIRRATLFSYFGVTPDELREAPLYTQVLAMDDVGRRLLAHMRKTASLSVITKPAEIEKLPAPAAAQAKRAYRADSVYTLAMPKVKAADLFIRHAPFVKDTK